MIYVGRAFRNTFSEGYEQFEHAVAAHIAYSFYENGYEAGRKRSLHVIYLGALDR